MDTTNTSHTPGPWTVATIDGDVCIGTETVNLCVMSASDCVADEMADAQLIAAAPELLEALQLCVRLLARFPATDPNGETVGTMVPEQARAAIAKATKGQQ